MNERYRNARYVRVDIQSSGEDGESSDKLHYEDIVIWMLV